MFLHYARTAADWLYEPEVRELARRPSRPHGSDYRATRGRAGGHLDAGALATCCTRGDARPTREAAVCGPPALIDGARAAWAQRRRRTPSAMLDRDIHAAGA